MLQSYPDYSTALVSNPAEETQTRRNDMFVENYLISIINGQTLVFELA